MAAWHRLLLNDTMSNNAELLNIPSLISDINALEGEWLGVAKGRNRIPAPWFYMFDSGDLGPSTIHYRVRDKDSGFRIAKAEILNPTTSVADARLRLARASRMFESSALNVSIVREYWDQVIAQLDSLPFPYLTIDPTEVLLMFDPKESAEEFARAFGIEPGAVELVKSFSSFVDEDSVTHPAALGGGFFDPEYRTQWSRTAEDRKNFDEILDKVPLEWTVA